MRRLKTLGLDGKRIIISRLLSRAGYKRGGTAYKGPLPRFSGNPDTHPPPGTTEKSAVRKNNDDSKKYIAATSKRLAAHTYQGENTQKPNLNI